MKNKKNNRMGLTLSPFYDKIKIQKGKESQRSQKLKKIKKVLDKTKSLMYNKDTK